MLLVLSAAEELTRQQPMKQPQISFLVKSQQLTCKLFLLALKGLNFFLRLFHFCPWGASFINILYVKKTTVVK